LLIRQFFSSSPETTSVTFADDTAVLATDNDPVMASNILQTNLLAIQSWLAKWRMKANGSKSTHITFSTRRGTCLPVHVNNIHLPRTEEIKYVGLYLDRRLTWHKHIFTKRKQPGIAFNKNALVTRTQIKTLYKQQIPHLQNYTQTNLGLRNTTLGNLIHVQHRNTRTLPVEGSEHDNGRIMVCVEYGNTEGSPNPNG
jgi:hypothetical protein